MNYAWEAALAADGSGVLREELRFVPACGSSPYTEIVQDKIKSAVSFCPGVLCDV